MQNNLLQLLHEQTEDLIWMVNPDFHLVYANSSYLNFMKDVTGREVKLNESVLIEGLGEDSIKKWKAFYSRALNGEKFEVEEQFLNTEIEKIKYSHIAFKPITGEKSEIISVACQSKDITHLVKQRSEAKQLLDSSLDVFCTFNEQGEFLFVNEAVKEHWGYTPEELVGTPYRKLVIEDDLAVTESVDITIRNGQEIKSFANRYRKKDGGIAYNISVLQMGRACKTLLLGSKGWQREI